MQDNKPPGFNPQATSWSPEHYSPPESTRPPPPRTHLRESSFNPEARPFIPQSGNYSPPEPIPPLHPRPRESPVPETLVPETPVIGGPFNPQLLFLDGPVYIQPPYPQIVDSQYPEALLFRDSFDPQPPSSGADRYHHYCPPEYIRPLHPRPPESQLPETPVIGGPFNPQPTSSGADHYSPPEYIHTVPVRPPGPAPLRPPGLPVPLRPPGLPSSLRPGLPGSFRPFELRFDHQRPVFQNPVNPQATFSSPDHDSPRDYNHPPQDYNYPLQTPQTPLIPETPETPLIPETPDTPLIPETPETLPYRVLDPRIACLRQGYNWTPRRDRIWSSSTSATFSRATTTPDTPSRPPTSPRPIKQPEEFGNPDTPSRPPTSPRPIKQPEKFGNPESSENAAQSANTFDADLQNLQIRALLSQILDLIAAGQKSRIPDPKSPPRRFKGLYCQDCWTNLFDFKCEDCKKKEQYEKDNRDKIYEDDSLRPKSLNIRKTSNPIMASSNKPKKDGKEGFHQEYIVSTRFRNELPPPPLPPKLLDIPHEGIERFCSPGFASNLARRTEPNIDVDAEGGMPIDLVGLPGLHLGDESSIMFPEPRRTIHQLDPADQALMTSLADLRKPPPKTANVSFLRRPQHISVDSSAPAPGSGVPAPQRRVMTKKTKAQIEDPKHVKKLIQKGFDIAYPESKHTGEESASEIRGLPATKAEMDAWANPVHPTNPRLKPVSFYPTLPDLDGFPDPGGYLQFKFDKAPVSAVGGKRDTRMDVSLLSPAAPDDRICEEHASKAALHKANPNVHPDPGPIPWNYNMYLPEKPEDAKKIRASMDLKNPGRGNAELYTHDDSEGNKFHQYDRLRTYETSSQALNTEQNKQRDYAVTLHQQVEGEKKQTAAFMYPILGKTRLKPERARTIARAGLTYKPTDVNDDQVDQLQVTVRDPDAEEAYKRAQHRANIDPKFGKTLGPAPKSADSPQGDEDEGDRMEE